MGTACWDPGCEGPVSPPAGLTQEPHILSAVIVREQEQAVWMCAFTDV